MTEKTITRTFHARVREDGRLLLSSEDPCPQDGYILDSRGWDLSRWEGRPMKMSYNHATYGPDDFPIGRWERLEAIPGDGLVGAPVFAADQYDRAAVAAKLNAGGFLDDVSVQFHVDETAVIPEVIDGKRFSRSMRHWPLEVGFVFIGADPRAGEARSRGLAEAVAAGTITRAEADAFTSKPSADPTPGALRAENDRLTTEAATLREELETLREEIGRLRTTAQPEGDPAPTVDRGALVQEIVNTPEIQGLISEARAERRRLLLEAAIAARINRHLGRLPD